VPMSILTIVGEVNNEFGKSPMMSLFASTRIRSAVNSANVGGRVPLKGRYV
jgi:hypothetical protein